MFKWYAIFKERADRETPLGEDESLRPLTDKFKATGEAGNLYGNELLGMWLVSSHAEQANVVQIWGSVPDPILQSFRAHQKRQLERESE